MVIAHADEGEFTENIRRYSEINLANDQFSNTETEMDRT